MYICMYLRFVFLLVAPSVTGITATLITDVPSNRYDYTIICTIHPESTADTCEVMVRSGEMSITSMCVDTYVRMYH